MSQASDYLENAVLNHVFRNTALSSPAAVYVGLFNGDPTDAGTGGTEVTTTIDATGRKEATFGAPSDGVITTSADVDFGDADGDATVSHFGIFDAADSGNLLAHGSITGGSQSISTGNAVKFSAGNLTITLA